VETGACLRTFAGHRSGVTCVCLSPDGQYALSGSLDRTVRLWEVGTGRCRRTFAAGAPVSAVCTSPDGSLALSGGHTGL
jgi:WD40 repeat protein